MYIELDHDLVPGKISRINESQNLPTGKEPQMSDCGETSKMNEKRYKVHQGDSVQAIKSHNSQRIAENQEYIAELKEREQWYVDGFQWKRKPDSVEKSKPKIAEKKSLSEFEAVAGTESGEMYYDHDMGFFSTILACYNNHWVLRTCADDWWNIIVRNVAQAIDDNGEKNKVRNFFVEHEGKKTITIIVGSLASMDYSWLFDQFSKGIHKNIKVPGYVEAMEADFSTTKPDQLISSQIMLMSSLQKYFDYAVCAECGIPGIEMKGNWQDWSQLVTKTENLKLMLEPIVDELGLKPWFESAITTLKKLLSTFEGNPDKDWWSHILSWDVTYGSGEYCCWSGWIIEFMRAGTLGSPKNFQSGTVSVPLKLIDNTCCPPVEDEGQLVAGTIGFTVEEGKRAPVVEAKQGWVLFLPKGSPVIPRMKV